MTRRPAKEDAAPPAPPHAGTAPVLWRPLDDQVLEVGGPDARSWLQGQVTADVRTLARGRAEYALALTPQGRVRSDLWIVQADGAALWLLVPSAAAGELARALASHVIMEDVELTPRAELAVLTLQGPSEACRDLARAIPHARAFECERLGGPGIDLVVPRADLATATAALDTAGASSRLVRADDRAWTDARVAARVPAYGVDFDASVHPHEAGLVARAVSFSKGCYVGQEAVAMIEHRGRAPRRLVVVEAPSALPTGAALVEPTGGATVGVVTSTSSTRTAAGGHESLALLRAEAALAGGVVDSPAGRARIVAVVGEPTT